jgi:hypothetical protein
VNELPFSQRVFLFLYSNQHIAGSVAALVGLGLFFGGIIDKGWWAIVAGLYAGGVLLMPRDDMAERIERTQFDESNLREHLSGLIKMARNKVPAEAGRLLESIREHAELLLPKLKELTERGALASNVRHDVLQALTRYLPDTLAGYLRLPPAYSRLHSDADGKTPDALLVEQLRLLEENLGRAVKQAFEEDITTLQVQGRFLAEKFTPAPH